MATTANPRLDAAIRSGLALGASYGASLAAQDRRAAATEARVRQAFSAATRDEPPRPKPTPHRPEPARAASSSVDASAIDRARANRAAVRADDALYESIYGKPTTQPPAPAADLYEAIYGKRSTR